MQWLAALCVRRPVFASVLILTLTVIGAFSFSRLGVDQFPKVDFPTVLITTVQPGAAPEQIETEVTDKIEEAVNTISGIDELRSTSSEGVSIVFISFQLDKNSDVAAQEVRDKLNAVLPLLPKTIQQPRVEKMDPDAAPILSLSLTANKPVREITEYADKSIRRQLESVSGVGQVVVLGGRKRQINVWLDADRMRAYNVTVTEISRALQSQNIEVPGGRVDQGGQSLTLRTRGRVQTVEEFNNIVIREADGHPVRVGDIARVEDGEADPSTIAAVIVEPVAANMGVVGPQPGFLEALRAENTQLRTEIKRSIGEGRTIVGEDPKIRRILDIVERVAERRMQTPHGEFHAIAFRDKPSGGAHLAK